MLPPLPISTLFSYTTLFRSILFHGKRHPAEMGAPEITRFLTALAVEGRVAASTQTQALSALLFLYRHVLELDLRSEEHTSELQSHSDLVCRLLLEKKTIACN